ncbi:hypothetical protein [Sandaracinobacteroides saxicola]|uniref:Uncharacterized protein n=1 Tax=Sandaracinobacteroides saxicola TaxID=2759707 RepID=A0A7G5IJ99_9SPHN|nr:hypothetical protein [Sandaracinobacteroides saxicola]QMW23441.1 hypothetical protein H3309_02755 [Sandaracinobacteroides saxicola]
MHPIRPVIGAAGIILAALSFSAAHAQGTDQLPAQRDLMVLGAWFAGDSRWDSIEQAYFEGRQRREGGNERDAVDFPRRDLTLERLATTDLLALRASVAGAPSTRWRFTATPEGVRLARDDAPGCDLLLTRAAASFTGSTGPGCRAPLFLDIGERTILLGPSPARATRYLKSRAFTCYVDIPGVGGGRAIPFKRFGPFTVPDQGGSARFDTHETPPRTLELRLRNVAWAYNNAPGVFTRNSLTLYIAEIAADGGSKELAYVFGEPKAQRIGMNLKQLLANCAMVPLKDAKPEF